MSEKRQLRIEQVFHAASELPKDQQASFVHQQLQQDPTAIQEVLELLALDDQDSVIVNRILNSPQHVSQVVIQELPLERVGAYVIEKEISHGGMGRVFLARRDDEAYESQVAIKLVRIERNNEWAHKRFLEERQILAKLNHPNIATLLDGGTTDQGQPYVVMQYIRGENLTSYCHKHKLGLKSKHLLFIKICQAISYAHKNLVIHRDIKPSNILVDAEGEPKLLDFGIAKIINDDFKAGDITQMGVMTPAYASPEQIRGESISTASDIYSLGVLLYELLTENKPFDVDNGSLSDIVQAICHSKPIVPSNKVSQPKLRKALQGDLDNIILKAMKKEAAQRYGSVDEFIADIRRYLSGHTVIATGDTNWYKTRKFIRRHWMGLSALSLFILTVAGIITFYTHKLATERDRAIQAEMAATEAQLEAERESKTATRVSDFLTDLFAANNPNADIGGKNMSARELLDIGSKSINESLSEEPKTKAQLLRTIGLAYFNLGDHEIGIRHLRESLALHQNHSDAPAQAEAMNRLANLLRQADEYEEAVKMHREALSLHESYSDKPTWELADAYNNFGLLLYSIAQYDEAEKYLNKAIKTHRAAAGGQDVYSVGINRHNLSLILRVKDQYQDAESMIKSALNVTAKFRGDDSNSWAISLQQLGRIQNDLGHYQLALQTLQEATEKLQVHYQADNTRMGSVWSRIANSYHALGHYETAAQHYQKAIAIFEQAQGKDSSLVVYTETNYGVLLRQMNRHQEAEDTLRHSLRVNQSLYIPSHPNISNTATELALVLAEKNQMTEASALIEVAIDGYKQHFNDDHPDLAWARFVKAKIDRHSGIEGTPFQTLSKAMEVLASRQHQNPTRYAQALHELALWASINSQCQSLSQMASKARNTLKKLNDQHPLLADWAETIACVD